MSDKLPAIRPRELVRALEKAGWNVHRQRGSHVIMHKSDMSGLVVVPMHTRDIPRGTLHGILEDAGLSEEELLELL